jgi:hypothetical protein
MPALDQTQQASLGLFKKVYEQRAAAGNAESESTSTDSSNEGEKKN